MYPYLHVSNSAVPDYWNITAHTGTYTSDEFLGSLVLEYSYKTCDDLKAGGVVYITDSLKVNRIIVHGIDLDTSFVLVQEILDEDYCLDARLK